MKIRTSEKFRIIMNRQNVSMTALAERSGQTRQNLSNKFSRSNLTEDDIEKIAGALSCGSISASSSRMGRKYRRNRYVRLRRY